MAFDIVDKAGTSDADLDQLVLARFPYPIAVNYRRLLAGQTWAFRTRKCIELYEYGVRMVTLSVLGQYLARDAAQVRNPELDKFLYHKLAEATLGSWIQFLFRGLKAYGGHRDLFFMPELYDLYWDNQYEPPQPRKGVQGPFQRLVELRNDLAHGFSPDQEADWKVLGQEALKHLRTILWQFQFLAHYRLIRVIAQHGEQYEYELYRGQEITRHQAPLQGSLQTGWFYLTRFDNTAIALHPLFIFWNAAGESQLAREEQREAAVYDRLLAQAVEYAATVARHMFHEHETGLVAQIRGMIESLGQAQASKRMLLSWEALRQATRELSDQQMGAAREKYQGALYLQREEVMRKFQDFLASDKNCFVLTGKSGVGKSGFVLSLADEYATRAEICLLVYNGARLTIRESLAHTISQDLALYLKLAGVADLLAELERTGQMTNRKFILAFDAINENSDGKAVLRQIDRLWDKQRYPWLKVLITSRHQAWLLLKQGLPLAEDRYYREQSSDNYRLEVPDLAIHLELFDPQELPQVYEKYRLTYALKTEYAELSASMQGILRDPLILRLVAGTYPGQPVPERIRVSHICEQYVTRLIETGRLYEKDLILLTRELVPLMLNEGQSSNLITAAQVQKATTTDGRSLWELIHSDDLLTNGHSVNESYVRLVDAEIIREEGKPPDYSIGFKYERFFDYYGGLRISELRAQQTEPVRYYADLIQETDRKPFLWGSIEYALTLEMATAVPDVLRQLCFTDSQRAKEMMVKVLQEAGNEAPGVVEQFLTELETIIPHPRHPLGRVVRLLHPPTLAINADQRNANKIAIEVASARGLPTILQEFCAQPDPTLRTTAIRYAYHLWQTRPEGGWAILEHLGREASRSRIPDLSVFESILGLSALIFFEHYEDVQILRKLQSVWQPIIAKFLGVSESSGRMARAIRTSIRETLFSLTIRTVFSLLDSFPQYNVVSYSEVAAFFRLEQGQKELYRRLTQYLNVEGPYTPQQMEADYLSALHCRNILIQGMTVIGLNAHLAHAPEEFFPFLQRFFEEAQQDPQPSPYISDIPNALQVLLDRDPHVDAVFDFFVKAVETTQTYYSEHRQITEFKRNRLYDSPEAMYLGPYVLYQYRRSGTVDTIWLRSRIQTALDKGDRVFFQVLLGTELALTGIEMHSPQAALSAVALFFSKRTQEMLPYLTRFLARLRLFYPNEVDNFLNAEAAPEDFRLQVRTSEVSETIGDLIGIRAWHFFRDAALNTPTLRNILMRVVERAADCRNARQWTDYAVREVVNLMYGSEVFREVL